jgi:hypothetical protein
MPAEDLLRFIGGPLPFPSWWLVLGIILIGSVVGWYAAVFVWTLPPSRLRRIPVIQSVHSRVNRRRFVRAVRRIESHYRDGGLTRAQAGAGISRVVRSFLYVATGVRAQYLHVQDLPGGRLAAAAPLLDDCNDAQFNPEARVDVAALGRSAQELIASWS